MSEADNPTTPRKRSSHRPAGFGPLPSRDKKTLAREPESPSDEADAPQPSIDLGSDVGSANLDNREARSDASLPPSLPEIRAGESEDVTAAVAETALPAADTAATVAWVSRLTAEFEATAVADNLEEQMQHLQDQNRRLQAQNRELLEQKAILEVTLEETQTALQLQMTRSQNQETLLVQQAQALAESQTQTSGLYRDLELAQQTAQRQQIMIETLTEQLESSQERVAQLEQEVATAQAHVHEKVHALMQAEIACRDLKTRLSRQQRYALQFKTALERCLDIPALRRSMVSAAGGMAEASPTADDPGNLDLSKRPGTDRPGTDQEKAPVSIAPSPFSNPNMTPADLVEVSSHLQSLLDEAAASSALEAAASLPIASRDVQDDPATDPERLSAPVLDGEAPLISEVSTMEITPLDRQPVDRLSVSALGSDRSFELSDDHWSAGEAIEQGPTVTTPDTPVESTAAVQAEVEPEAMIAEAIPEGRDEAAESRRSEASPTEQAVVAAPPFSPVRFPADRIQADLWQRFNQWAAASGVEEPSATEAQQPEGPPPLPTTADADLTAEAIVPPPLSTAQRGIQPLRPSPQVPRFFSQWSEATGRAAAADRRPSPLTGDDAAEVQVATPVTSFTVAHRRPGATPPAAAPIAQTQPATEPVTPANPPAATRKRIELPRPQAEEETAALAAAGPAVTPARTRENEFQAMANWPSPLVYPLRPSKKRKSLAAIDLPNFARPHS